MTPRTLELALRLTQEQQQQQATTSRMFLENNTRPRPSRPLRQRTRTKKMTTNNNLSTLLLSSCWALLIIQQVAHCQLYGGPGPASELEQQLDELTSSARVTEILVQPGAARRIECRLPSLEKSPKRIFHWNLQRSSTGKMNLLCVRDECPEDAALGIQLKNDSSTNAYDLIIPRVSYDQHDGLYSCYYRDVELNRTITREFRLTVLIPPQPPLISAVTPQLAREGQEHQLNCTSQGGNPEPQISWFRSNGEQIAAGQPGFIKIEQRTTGVSTTSLLSFVPTADDHQSTYRCKVWNKAMVGGEPSSLGHEREYTLQVEYSPRISVGQFNPLRVLQGSPVTLSCLVEANPPVKGIKWFKDGTSGQPISNQFNHTILEARTSDAGDYICQADNGIAPLGSYAHHAAANQHSSPASSAGILSGFFGSSSPLIDSRSTASEAQLQLQVLYGPRLSVRPYPPQIGSPRQLGEGESFALNCSVDASPPAFEIVWTKADDPSFRRVMPGEQTILEFSSLSALDSGNYTCTAFNRLNPSAINQPQAPLSERQGSASYALMVRHKPGVALIELGSQGETELGTKTQIVCRAKPPGYPEPTYKFWKISGNGNKNVISKRPNHGPSHTIIAAKHDDEARYGCEASNDLGVSTEAEGELIVNEPPQIIQDNILRADGYSLPPGERGVAITVRASGKPEPKVRWFHRSPIDGRVVELSNEMMQSRYEIIPSPPQIEQRGGQRPKYTVTSTLKFKHPIEVNDRGQYSVEFDNGLSRTAVQRTQVHVHHSPIPAPKNQPILVPGSGSGSAFGRGGVGASSSSQTNSQLESAQFKAGFELNETVNLTCRVSAHPEPQFEWHDKSSSELAKPISTNTRYRATISNPIDDIWESTLTFDALQESDYGDYLCVTANQDARTQVLGDSIKIIVSLVHKTLPDIPSQLEATEANQDSIALQWNPGFDGGGTNLAYQVQYAPDDGSGQSLSKRYPDSAAVALADNSLDAFGEPMLAAASESFPRLQSCQTPSTCTIEHLSPRQAYLFRVRARSSMGTSDFSDQLRASTRANLSQIPKILEASYDQGQNILYFRVEPGSDYLLNNLNARVEIRGSLDQPASQSGEQSQPAQAADQWQLHSLVPMRSERAQAHLNMQPDVEHVRLTLCSKSNESLCGPELLIGLRSAASSFLQDQRGLSVTMLALSLLLIAVLGLVATSIHSCCMSRRKNKKADAIDGSSGQQIDNKPAASNGQLTANGMSQTNGDPSSIIKGSHGSTTSTNSTSATANGLVQHSMDSIVNGSAGLGGSNSDHSSDHSRQAKLDSMLPPNYNHYADRASILMEQQQQQQAIQQAMQQQGLMSTIGGGGDKLGSPFGLANNALLGVTGHHQMPSPMMNGAGSNYFTYGQTPMDFQQQEDQMLGLETTDGKQQQQQMWQQQDEYSNYNALAYSTLQQQQQDAQQQVIDPTYGTAASLMMPQQSAAYDNSSNQQFAASQQQFMSSQYQQELANAQQQMYGTLTRNSNGYSAAAAAADTSSLAHDQQQQTQQQLYEQQYGTTGVATNGLAQQQQESDYGTTGARRPIREIIV